MIDAHDPLRKDLPRIFDLRKVMEASTAEDREHMQAGIKALFDAMAAAKARGESVECVDPMTLCPLLSSDAASAWCAGYESARNYIVIAAHLTGEVRQLASAAGPRKLH